MKNTTLLALTFLISLAVTGQNSIKESYNDFRSTIQGINNYQLEKLYERPEEKYIKGFTEDPYFKNISYLDSIIQKLELTSDELDLLKQNRFFVTERLSHQTFGSAFHLVYNHDLPVFVTTDAVLHALHMSYNQILKSMEREIMAANLEQFLASLYNNFDVLIQKYGSTEELDHSLKDADLYLSIAYSLITDELQEGHIEDSSKIRNVWEKIGAEKMVSMPLFTFPDRNRELDFSQFTVRGHYVYTQQDQWMGLKSLEPYFRTMMWLGRTDFLLTAPPDNPWEQPWKIDEIARMHQAAFMVNELFLQSTNKELFDFNENIINYLVGESDNILPEEYAQLLQNLSITSAEQLTDTLVVRTIIDEFNQDEELGQKILSDFFFMDPNGEAPGDLPISYRMSGQRFIIDSYVLGNVVFDRLMQNGGKIMRMMPNPLDAMFALGNNDALPLLEPEFEKQQYAEQLAKLRFLLDQKPESFWNASLYNVWLNGIRELNPKPVPYQPLFMKTAAWHQQKMNTQLASWSQLRHDNLLYAKQSYTGATGCSFPYSYVEPYPEFYSRLKEFADDAGSFFSQIPTTNYEISKVAQFFPDFAATMEKLEKLAKKELNRTPFTDDENDWLKAMLFQQAGSGIPPYSGWFADLFYDAWDAAKGDFTVVDIHTQPTDEFGTAVGKVLHTGIGMVNLGVFITDCPGNYENEMAFVGPVMSYYETTTNNFKRLTDQEWEQVVYDSRLPDRPKWTNIYLADKMGEQFEKSIELPSKMYTSVAENDWDAKSIRLYPNPATDKINIVSHQHTDMSVQVYNSQGVLLLEQAIQRFNSSGAQIDVSSLKTGIYLVRVLKEGEQEFTSKLIKR